MNRIKSFIKTCIFVLAAVVCSAVLVLSNSSETDAKYLTSKSVSFNLNVHAKNDIKLKTGSALQMIFDSLEHYCEIEEIYFVYNDSDYLDGITLKDAGFVASATDSVGEARIYYDSSNYAHLYIVGSTKMYANQSSKDLFLNRTYLEKIVFENFDTSDATDMSYMFANCISLREIVGLENFNTSKVTTMHGMFLALGNPKYLDSESEEEAHDITLNLSGFITTSVTDYMEMFACCSGITELDLSSFSSYSGTDFRKMFYDCPELTTIYTSVTFNLYKKYGALFNQMFSGDLKLTGRNGTKNTIGLNNNDSEYFRNKAKVDGTKVDYSDDGTGFFSIVIPDNTLISGQELNDILKSTDATNFIFGYTAIYEDILDECSSPVDVSAGGSIKLYYHEETETAYILCDYDMYSGRDCSHMFEGLEIDSIRLENFNSKYTEDTSYMFANCDAVELDLTGMTTESVKKYDYMFAECSDLENVICPDFVLYCSFGSQYHYYSETSISMIGLYKNCTSLKTCDFTWLNGRSITIYGKEAFYNCKELERIYCSYYDYLLFMDSDNMFYNCIKLVTDHGVTYLNSDELGRDHGGNHASYYSQYGYFTPVVNGATLLPGKEFNTTMQKIYRLIDADKRVYVYFGYYGKYASLIESDNWVAVDDKGEGEIIAVYDRVNNDIYIISNKVINFNADCSYMFRGVSELYKVDLDYESNCSNVYLGNIEDMSYMFMDCVNLNYTSIYEQDVSRVKTMKGMFKGCTSFKGDYVFFESSYDSLSDVSEMFYGCTSMTYTSFDMNDNYACSGKISDASYMFYGCSSITEIEIPDWFDLSEAKSTRSMFEECTNLQTIYCSQTFKKSTFSDSEDMFYNCQKLKGMSGTAYAKHYVYDASFARPDTNENKGYFSYRIDLELYIEGINYYLNEEYGLKATTFIIDSYEMQKHNVQGLDPLSENNMFRAPIYGYFDASSRTFYILCEYEINLYYIDMDGVVEELEIHNVKYLCDYLYVFDGATSLKTITLDFSVPENISYDSMFSNDVNLTTIYVSDKFNLEPDEDMTDVFENCDKLVGGRGTKRSDNKGEVTYDYWNNPTYHDGLYARVDGSSSNPGFFTKMPVRTVPSETNYFYTSEEFLAKMYSLAMKIGRTGSIFPSTLVIDYEESEYSNMIAQAYNPESFDMEDVYDDLNDGKTVSFLMDTDRGIKTIYTVNPDNSSELYMLSRNTIYAAEDSSRLFENVPFNNIYLNNFNTEYVTDMSRMFADSTGLDELNLSGFDTSKVTDMSEMFEGNEYLSRIYVSKKFVVGQSAVTAGMFEGCTSLVGGDGFKFRNDAIDDKFAKIDGYRNQNGYFSVDQMVDADKFLAIGSILLNSADIDFSGFTDLEIIFGYRDDYKNVLKNNLGSISLSIDTLNYYAEEEEIIYPLYECPVLYVGEDRNFYILSTFDIYAGNDCSNLLSGVPFTSITFENFDTTFTTNMQKMFANSSILEEINGLDNFNTENVINMTGMFMDLPKVKMLDLRSFNTAKVETMTDMFKNDILLREIIATDSFVTTGLNDPDNTNSGTNMFYNCTNLRGYWNLVYGNIIDLETDALTPIATTDYQFAKINRPVYDGSLSFDLGFFTFPYFFNSLDLRVGFSTLESADTFEVVFGYKDDYPDVNKTSAYSYIVDELFDIYIYHENKADSTVHAVIYVLSDDTIYANPDCSYLFYGMSNMTAVRFENFDTRNVTNMSHMFDGCSGLKAINLQGLDISGVTDMEDMFANTDENLCAFVDNVNDFAGTGLQNISPAYCFNRTMLEGIVYAIAGNEIEDVDLSEVTLVFDYVSKHMDIFNDPNCNKGEIVPGEGIYICIDYSGYKIYVLSRNTIYAYENCTSLFESVSLKAIEFNNFNTEYVTDMSGMFIECGYLKSLDLSGFDTSNVENMGSMFAGCISLTEIDGLNSFDTSEVTDMSDMFYCCEALDEIDVSSFDTSSVNDMRSMFYGCSYAKKIKGLGNFDTANVTDMAYMFYGMKGVYFLDLSGFDVSNVADISFMFADCTSLEDIYVGTGFRNLDNIEDSSNMFYDCYRLSGNTRMYEFDSSNPTDLTYAKECHVVDAGSGDYTLTSGYFTSTDFYTPIEFQAVVRSFIDNFPIIKNNLSSFTLTFDYRDNHPEFTDDELEFSSFGMQVRPGIYVKLDAENKICYVLDDEDIVVSDCTGMFADFGFGAIELLNLDTRNVVSMYGMFANSTDGSANDTSDNLKLVNLGNMDITSLEDTSYMFYGNSGLATIVSANDFPEDLNSSVNMFGECTSLHSYWNTGFDSDHADAEYAKVERPIYDDESGEISGMVIGYLTSPYFLDAGGAHYAANTISSKIVTMLRNLDSTLPEDMNFLIGKSGVIFCNKNEAPENQFVIHGYSFDIVVEPLVDNSGSIPAAYCNLYFASDKPIVFDPNSNYLFNGIGFGYIRIMHSDIIDLSKVTSFTGAVDSSTMIIDENERLISVFEMYTRYR